MADAFGTAGADQGLTSAALEQLESGIDIGRSAQRRDRLGHKQGVRDVAAERLPCVKRMGNDVGGRGVVLGEPFRPVQRKYAFAVAIEGKDVLVVGAENDPLTERARSRAVTV